MTHGFPQPSSDPPLPCCTHSANDTSESRIDHDRGRPPGSTGTSTLAPWLSPVSRIPHGIGRHPSGARCPNRRQNVARHPRRRDSGRPPPPRRGNHCGRRWFPTRTGGLGRVLHPSHMVFGMAPPIAPIVTREESPPSVNGDRVDAIATLLHDRFQGETSTVAKWDDPLFWNIEASPAERCQFLAIGNAIKFSLLGPYRRQGNSIGGKD